MNREHSVSWAGAEYHPDHTPCKYALPTIDLRCDQAPPTTQLRPKQTHPRLIYAVFPLALTHIRPDSDCSRSSNGNVPVRLPKKGSSKVSLGLCRSEDPAILEGHRLRHLFHPSIHSRLVWSILLRTLQTVLLTMRYLYLFCWWPVRSVLPTVRSVQLTTSLHRNSSPRTVCCSTMTCWFRIWTKCRAPYSGSI